MNGTIDYERITSQHELGEIRSVSAAQSCVEITANAGFVAGGLTAPCVGNVACPCLELEVPEDFCPDTTTPPPVVECSLDLGVDAPEDC